MGLYKGMGLITNKGPVVHRPLVLKQTEFPARQISIWFAAQANPRKIVEKRLAE